MIRVRPNEVIVAQLRAVAGMALPGAIFNARVGLVGVVILRADARGGFLLAAIGAILGVAYREYASAEQIVADVLAQVTTDRSRRSFRSRSVAASAITVLVQLLYLRNPAAVESV